MRVLHIVIITQRPPADKIDFFITTKMWRTEEVKFRLREYIVPQLINWFRFLLSVNDIVDSGDRTFEQVCADERAAFIHTHTHTAFGEQYDRPNLCVPNYKCLWDIIFNTIGYCIPYSYTPIFSAYCRSNDISRKDILYSTMSKELKSWVDTIDSDEDLITIAIGMSKNTDIFDTFTTYTRRRDEDGVYKRETFYTDALEILIKNNFENIDPYSYNIQPYLPIKQKYDDPLQQIFYKFIMIVFRVVIQEYWMFTKTPKSICELLSETIYGRFNVEMYFRPTYAEIGKKFENIDQIIEYAESKIPQYPSRIKPQLLILQSINGSGYDYDNNKQLLANLAKMAELSKYNLRELPITAIVYGYCCPKPLHEIPLEQIPEYYARLTQSYSGFHTKTACR